MTKRNITIDDLAVMVQRGFKEMAKQVEVDKRFDAVEERLDRIEKLILVDHKRRIERLEEQVRDLGRSSLNSLFCCNPAISAAALSVLLGVYSHIRLRRPSSPRAKLQDFATKKSLETTSGELFAMK